MRNETNTRNAIGPARGLKTPWLLAEAFVSQAAASVDDPEENCTPEEFFQWAHENVTAADRLIRLPPEAGDGMVIRMNDGGAAVIRKHREDGESMCLLAAAKVDANGIAWAPIDMEGPDWARITDQRGPESWSGMLSELRTAKADSTGDDDQNQRA